MTIERRGREELHSVFLRRGTTGQLAAFWGFPNAKQASKQACKHASVCTTHVFSCGIACVRSCEDSVPPVHLPIHPSVRATYHIPSPTAPKHTNPIVDSACPVPRHIVWYSSSPAQHHRKKYNKKTVFHAPPTNLQKHTLTLSPENPGTEARDWGRIST